MFSRRKSYFKRRGFYILLAAILAFGYFVNQELTHKDEDITANAQTETSDGDRTVGQTLRDNETDISGTVPRNISGSGIQSYGTDGGYYLVKEHNGVIKVFYYDSRGTESVLSDTNIAFSLVGEEDQQMFKDGIIVNTKDELQNLLENFES